jgi:arylsulfatase A-like enzyme
LEDYHAAMRYTDGFLEDLFHGFESRGMMANTVFVVLGDHGEAFGEHGMWQHSHVVYDEVLHVPGVVLAPGLLAGVADGPRSTIDVLPTIADLLDLEVRGTFPGQSMLAAVEENRTLYSGAWNAFEAAALRRGNIKYVVREGRPVEVFDTARDPGERNSIANRVHPDTIAAVRDELTAWRGAVDNAWRAVACP